MASIEGAGNAALPAGGRPEPESSLYLRIKQTKQVMTMRSRIVKGETKPMTWRAIGKALGISHVTAMNYYADGMRWGEVEDVMGVVDSAIALRDHALIELSEVFHAAKYTQPAAAVGAVRAMMAIDLERVRMLQSAGRLPHNLARWRSEADFATITREFMAILERRGIGGEVLDELQTLVERHTPDHAENVRPISSARSVGE